ncbi:hypothetical protein ACJJIW_12385 [Microbulbifer sp. JMSA004]|uniref:hypothetical protein n=1 Tax=Microbulbifer sp. JMSA004 TaxID=3243370 RepID=UPI0040390D76
MKNISRQEFVRGSGRLIMLAIFSYVTFLFLQGISNISVEGRVFLGYIAIIFLGFYTTSLLINRLIERYQFAHGDKAKKTIAALSLTIDAVMVGICSAMALRALYEDRFDNIIIWFFMIAYSIYHIYKHSKEKMENG